MDTSVTRPTYLLVGDEVELRNNQHLEGHNVGELGIVTRVARLLEGIQLVDVKWESGETSPALSGARFILSRPKKMSDAFEAAKHKLTAGMPSI